MTTKLLLIRAEHDGFTSQASEAADLVKTYAENNGWTVVDKAGNGANKNDVLAALKGTINFVIHYGHGEKDALFGQTDHGNKKEKIFDKNNIGQSLKNNKISLSTVSCLSASELGNAAAPSPSGVNAYLGYNVEIAFPKKKSTFINIFYDAYNEPNKLLLSGQPFQKALQDGRAFFLQKYQQVQGMNNPNIDPREKFFALSYLDRARDALTLCGNGAVTAK